MEIASIIPHIEALIFASDKPLTAIEITEHINNAFGFMEDKLTLEQIETSIEGIKEKYNADFYPFEIRESGGGLQFLTKKEFHKTVAQLNGDKFLKRLSPTTLETLAIIAYKQPITKGEIEAIRGVSSDYSVQRLLEKELIIIAGRNEEMPGKPLVYTTSKSFMDYFGLNNVDELPKIREVLAEQVIPTSVHNEEGLATQEMNDGDTTTQLSLLTMVETETEVDPNTSLVVSESGELLAQSLHESEAETEFEQEQNPDQEPDQDEDGDQSDEDNEDENNY